jgi:hypothetical protein
MNLFENKLEQLFLFCVLILYTLILLLTTEIKKNEWFVNKLNIFHKEFSRWHQMSRLKGFLKDFFE